MTDRTHLTARVMVPLPWTRLPLSQNDRGGWQAKHFPMQDAIDVVATVVGHKHPSLRIVGCDVILHMWPTTRHRRDTDNLAPTLKACMDALVAVGTIPDDSWVHVPFSGHRIHEPTKEPPYGAMFVLELRPCDG